MSTMLFPKTEHYVFNGSALKVVCVEGKTRINRPIFTATRKIYLGRFLGMRVLHFHNKEIKNGLAVFENGSIMFSDFQWIQISIEKNVNPHLRHSNLYNNYFPLHNEINYISDYLKYEDIYKTKN